MSYLTLFLPRDPDSVIPGISKKSFVALCIRLKSQVFTSVRGYHEVKD